MANKVKLPTLDQLNKVSCSKIVLLHCRILMTSDFTFHYSLYHPSVIKDIIVHGKSLLDIDANTLEDKGGLTIKEKTELLGYFNILEEYCGDA